MATQFGTDHQSRYAGCTALAKGSSPTRCLIAITVLLRDERATVVTGAILPAARSAPTAAPGSTTTSTNDTDTAVINWSGSVRVDPAVLACPTSEDEIVEIVKKAAAEGKRVRPMGSGHSSSRVFATDDVLVSSMAFTGMIDHDTDRCEATFRPGTTLHDAGDQLHEVGLAFPNLGDIDKQAVAGSFATGTHGSGHDLQNLSAMLIGGRLVTGDGSVRAFTLDQDPDLTHAAQVSLGVLGIFTEMTLRPVPSYKLHRQEWCSQVDALLDHLPELIAGNRAMDFYWYPRNDEIKIRLLNIPGEGTTDLDYAWLLQNTIDWSHNSIAQTRNLKFEEMEYQLPAENGIACFREVRERVKARHRHIVGWRLLYRTIAPDDAFLSPASGRQTVTISLHQNSPLPYERYFSDIEPIFRAYGGRPHWGKKHSLTADQLRPLYPQWDQFQAIRRELDPNGVFMSDAMRRLLDMAA